jgi:hypothetical protein
MKDSSASGKRIEAAKRRTEAMELRIAGATYTQIAERLGCTKQRAHAIVTEEMEKLTRARTAAAEALVALESERLDRVQLGVWSRAVKGDLDAVNALLRLMNRRAKLLGLDTPTAMNIGVNKMAPVMLNIVEETVDAPQVHGPVPEGAAAPCTDTLPNF